VDLFTSSPELSQYCTSHPILSNPKIEEPKARFQFAITKNVGENPDETIFYLKPTQYFLNYQKHSKVVKI
jgi:hypothetical protein